jgi:hypothetical protein
MREETIGKHEEKSHLQASTEAQQITNESSILKVPLSRFQRSEVA